MICVHEFTAKGGLHDKSNDYFRTPYNQTFIVQRANSYMFLIKARSFSIVSLHIALANGQFCGAKRPDCGAKTARMRH